MDRPTDRHSLSLRGQGVQLRRTALSPLLTRFPTEILSPPTSFTVFHHHHRLNPASVGRSPVRPTSPPPPFPLPLCCSTRSSSPRRNYKHSFHTKSRWRCPGLSETSPARVAFSLRIATRPLPTTALPPSRPQNPPSPAPPPPPTPSSFQRFPRWTLFQICTITGRTAANADSSDARSFRLTFSRTKKFFCPSPSGCFSSGRIRMRKYWWLGEPGRPPRRAHWWMTQILRCSGMRTRFRGCRVRMLLL